MRFIEVKKHYWSLEALNYFFAYCVSFQLKVSEKVVIFFPIQVHGHPWESVDPRLRTPAVKSISSLYKVTQKSPYNRHLRIEMPCQVTLATRCIASVSLKT